MLEEIKKGNGFIVVEGGEEIVDTHDDVRSRVVKLKDRAEETYWDLGVVLSEIYENCYYRDWEYTTWPDYVQDELDMHIKTAQDLIKIRKWFDNLPESIQAWAKGLGYTKVRELRKIVTPENAGIWKAKVNGKTVAEIIKLMKAGREEDTEDDQGAETEQCEKVEKSRKRAFSLFPEQDEIVEDALRLAKEMAESDKEGHALALICMDYVASNSGEINIEMWLKEFERISGMNLVALRSSDDGTSVVVYGYEYMEREFSTEEIHEDHLKVVPENNDEQVN